MSMRFETLPDESQLAMCLAKEGGKGMLEQKLFWTSDRTMSFMSPDMQESTSDSDFASQKSMSHWEVAHGRSIPDGLLTSFPCQRRRFRSAASAFQAAENVTKRHRNMTCELWNWKSTDPNQYVNPHCVRYNLPNSSLRRLGAGLQFRIMAADKDNAGVSNPLNFASLLKFQPSMLNMFNRTFSQTK